MASSQAAGWRPFSKAALNAEINEFCASVIISEGNFFNICERYELNLIEEVRIANIIRSNRKNDEEFLSLKDLFGSDFRQKAQPILNSYFGSRRRGKSRELCVSAVSFHRTLFLP
jgi:hypothetical protein